MPNTMKSSMHVALAAVTLVFWSGSSLAYNGFSSEIAHVAGGAVMASAATAWADRYGLENRRVVGFGTSVALSFVAEGAQIVSNGSQQIHASMLDFTSNAIGAAIGAWVTDAYFLAPVVTRDAQGQRKLGIAMRMSF